MCSDPLLRDIAPDMTISLLLQVVLLELPGLAPRSYTTLHRQNTFALPNVDDVHDGNYAVKQLLMPQDIAKGTLEPVTRTIECRRLEESSTGCTVVEAL